MKRTLVLPLLLIVAMTAGCIGKAPQTPDEFRQFISSSMLGKHECYEVARSTKDIGKTFQKYGDKCLDKRIEVFSQHGTVSQHVITKYTPTLIVNNNRVEFHLQEKDEHGVISVYEEPEGGQYLFIADIVPVGTSKSKVDFYRPALGYGDISTALKNWIEGKNLGCPDLTD